MKALIITAAALLYAAIIAGLWLLFQVCFNAVVHGVFGGPEITYWQAAACVVLLGFIARVFKGTSAKADKS